MPDPAEPATVESGLAGESPSPSGRGSKRGRVPSDVWSCVVLLAIATLASMLFLAVVLASDAAEPGDLSDASSGGPLLRSSQGEEPQESTHRQRVAVFSTTDNPRYLFYAPLTAMVWSRVFGYQPLLFLVTRTPNSSLVSLAVEACADAGALVEVVRPPESFPAEEDATLSQLVRLFAPMLPEVRESGTFNGTYFLTTDVDMWPIDREAFARPMGLKRRLHIMFSNAYETPPELFTRAYRSPDFLYPMCYLGASGPTWAEIMGYDRNRTEKPSEAAMRTIVAETKRLGAEWAAGKERSVRWNFDQLTFGTRVSSWRGHPSECEMFNRTTMTDRLDRTRWGFTGEAASLAGKVDCHVLRPGYTKRKWARMASLFGVLVPDRLAWAQRYRKRFLKLLA